MIRVAWGGAIRSGQAGSRKAGGGAGGWGGGSMRGTRHICMGGNDDSEVQIAHTCEHASVLFSHFFSSTIFFCSSVPLLLLPTAIRLLYTSQQFTLVLFCRVFVHPAQAGLQPEPCIKRKTLGHGKNPKNP